MTRKTPTIIGAAVGLALFLAIGLLPALLYGGYAGVMLASGIAGIPGLRPPSSSGPSSSSGWCSGATGVGALFAVGGAVIGAAIAVLTGVPAKKEAAKGAKA